MLLKDIDNARECFKEALSVDLKCYDALEALVKYNLMGEQAGKQSMIDKKGIQFDGCNRVGICHDATI